MLDSAELSRNADVWVQTDHSCRQGKDRDSLGCLDVLLLFGSLQTGLHHLQQLNQHSQDTTALHHPSTWEFQLLRHKAWHASIRAAQYLHACRSLHSFRGHTLINSDDVCSRPCKTVYLKEQREQQDAGGQVGGLGEGCHLSRPLRHCLGVTGC